MPAKVTERMSELEAAVVQVLSNHVIINFSNPWTIRQKKYSSGTGFAIEVPLSGNSSKKGRFVITNAHCVYNSTRVQLRRRGRSNTFLAEIAWVVYECDLALLTVKEEEFWRGMAFLEFGEMPRKLEKAFVYGYPLGGYNVSITKGVINRVQVITYFNLVENIVIQTDAPINFGNSGGPVLDRKNKVIGVAFAGEDDTFTQNMGYMIPLPIIHYFLASFHWALEKKVEKFPGLCTLEVGTQNLQNSVLRSFLKLPSNKTGVLITEVAPYSEAKERVRALDVLLAVDGIPVNNDGTVALSPILALNPRKLGGEELNSEKGGAGSLGEGEIVSYRNYVALKKPGERIKLTLWREGEERELEVSAEPFNYSIPLLEYQSDLSYLILMGILFLPLSVMLAREKKRNGEEIGELVSIMTSFQPQKKGQQILLLADVFNTEYTEGVYPENQVLDELNSKKIVDMKDLVKTVEKESRKKEFLTFTFTNSSQILVLKSSDVRKQDEKIRKNNFGNIPPYRV